MREKFCVLKIIQPTSLELAFIRNNLSKLIYVEIDNTFFISSSKSFKDTFSEILKKEKINFIFTYVNIKAGCDIFTYGINQGDVNLIKNIVLDKNS